MSRPDEERPTRAEHKRILEVAAANPDASPADIADELSNVSRAAVEKVLDEGDGPDASAGDADTPGAYPDREDIPERQIRTLQAIAAHPDATQRDIASFLDVTAATVSNRVNSLPGFEWEERRRFVKEVLDLDSIPGRDRSVVVDSTEIDLQETIEDLLDRVERLEQLVEASDEGDSGDGSSPFDDPELTRKVVHACMAAEEITEEEEHLILEHFVE